MLSKGWIFPPPLKRLQIVWRAWSSLSAGDYKIHIEQSTALLNASGFIYPSGTPYDKSFELSVKVYPSGTPYDKSFELSVKVYPSGTPYDKSFALSVKV